MEFSLTMLYDVDKKLGGDVKKLDKAFVNKSSKEVLVNLVESVAGNEQDCVEGSGREH